jgi:hypothetical protein
MTYIQFYIFSGGLENYLLPGFFETSVIILAIMIIPEIVVGGLAIKISNNKIFIFKII